MNLEELLSTYAESAYCSDLNNALSNEKVVVLKGLKASSKAFVLAGLFKKGLKNHLFIAENSDAAAYMENDLSNILKKKDMLFFPHSFKKIGDFKEENKHNVLLRAEVLNRLLNPKTSGEIILTYPEALIEKVVKSDHLKENILHMKKGERLDIDFILEMLSEYGFKQEDFVYEPGEYSVRGGIIDIYSFGNDHPYRIELFDDEVESLRTFDVESQLSIKKISELTIIPNINNQFSKQLEATIFDFLPQDTAVWSIDEQLLIDTMLKQFDAAADAFEDLDEDGLHPFSGRTIESQFINPHQTYELIDEFKQIKVEGAVDSSNIVLDYSGQIQTQPDFDRNFELLIKNFKEQETANIESHIFSGNDKQIERFYHIFDDLQANVKFSPIQIPLSGGFIDHTLSISCYTDHQIFNRYHKYKIRQGYSRSKAINVRELREMVPGDYITHLDHGVGVFSGLEKIEINGQFQESVRIRYKDNDLLYVNINSLHKISKYSGKEGKVPRVNKLGSDAWQALKRKTKRKVKDIAKELIKIYAQRKAQKGFAFAPDSYLQDELEASFIYEDTPDQETATIAVKKDMEVDAPMDRLICGDVGFGKTEVAIRAAFKAVNDLKQVAVLVPTTILALQHYRTFSERLEQFPCKIDYINRFKSTKEKTATLKKVKEGVTDILIGTHAILGKKVEFKDLGLLIIDEEQKFGVSAKEKLRSISSTVDTLTLTATPIPRTLKFSLMGARDLSIIQTAPPNRQPVTTEVHALNPELIKDAVEFEVYRGGQVFFVHNRIKDIVEVETMLKRLMPEIEIVVAHGQMEGKALEKKIMDFIEGRYDVLLCTNIVESGIDIPNANTIIINNAQNFGLSDLHQLRGRVGRSNKKAFCYLFSPPISTLTPDARRRLKTLEEFSELGSGFNISMRDMDIRGAGNLLGGEQSGFIADIGFEMYHKILDEAIQELKFTEFKDLFQEELTSKDEYVSDCHIETDYEMLIPEEYVESRDERLRLYTELDNVSSEEVLEEFSKKLIDRFGSLPKNVNILFDTVRFRWKAKKLGFEKVILKKRKLRCYFPENQDSPYFETERFGSLLDYLQKSPGGWHIKQTPQRLMLVKEAVRSIGQADHFLDELLKNVD